jgi:WD40 repeat protein
MPLTLESQQLRYLSYQELLKYLTHQNISKFSEHEKTASFLCLSASKDWLFTWSADGYITVRTLIEPDKRARALAHDFYSGGVQSIFMSPDCRSISSIGRDGLLRFWEWKYSTSGKRIAYEATSAVQALEKEQASALADYAKNLNNHIATHVYYFYGYYRIDE